MDDGFDFQPIKASSGYTIPIEPGAHPPYLVLRFWRRVANQQIVYGLAITDTPDNRDRILAAAENNQLPIEYRATDDSGRFCWRSVHDWDISHPLAS